jgi:hypothetical protein
MPTQVQLADSVAFGHGSRSWARALSISLTRCGCEPPWPPAWTPATFAHEKHFLLDRDHNVPCATCHLGNVFSRYTCYGCHEHTVSNIERKHRKEGITDFKNCVTCHRSASEEPEHGRAGGREAGKSGEAGEAVTSGKPGNSGDRRERD